MEFHFSGVQLLVGFVAGMIFSFPNYQEDTQVDPPVQTLVFQLVGARAASERPFLLFTKTLKSVKRFAVCVSRKIVQPVPEQALLWLLQFSHESLGVPVRLCLISSLEWWLNLK